MVLDRTTRAKVSAPLYGIAGQLLNAGTNVATAFVASYLLVPDSFGRFVLAYAVVTMLLAAGRGLIGTTLLTHLPGLDDRRRDELAASALGFTLCAGVVATAVVALAAIVLPTLLYFVPWVLAALFQDACRHVFLAVRRTGAALLLDVAWALAQIGVFAVWLLASARITIGVVACAWGAGALAGAVTFVLLSSVRPRRPGPWIRTTRDIAGWFVATAVIGQTEIYLVLLLVGTVLAEVDAGGLRAVQLIALQPALVLLGSILILVTPTFAKLGPDAPPGAIGRAAARVSVLVLPVIALLLLLVPLRLPVMSLVLPQYLAYESVVLPVVLQSVLFAISVPAMAVLRGLRRGAQVFWLQLARIVLVTAGTLVGLTGAGLLGIVWTQVAAGVVSLVCTALVARAAARAPAPPR